MTELGGKMAEETSINTIILILAVIVTVEGRTGQTIKQDF